MVHKRIHTGRKLWTQRLRESLQQDHSFYFLPEHPHWGETLQTQMTEKKPSVGIVSSQGLCEYTQRRNTMTMMNSEKPSTETLNLPNTCKYILERKSMNAMIVKKFSEVTHPMGKMWAHTSKISFIYVMNVGMASMIPLAFTDMKIHTDRNLWICTMWESLQPQILFYIRELLQGNKLYECFTSIS